MLEFAGKQIETDKEGYLKNLQDWSPEVANQIALVENIELSDAHWEILNILIEFYKEFQLSPNNRVLVKKVKLELGPEKGNSIYLMTLFPESPAKLAAKIAGLPRPTNCF